MTSWGACQALLFLFGSGLVAGGSHPGPPVFLELHLNEDGVHTVLNGEQNVLLEWLGVEGPMGSPLSESERAIIWGKASEVLPELVALDVDGARVLARLQSIESLPPFQGSFGAEVSLVFGVDYGLLEVPQEITISWSLFPTDTLGGESRLPVHLIGESSFDFVSLTQAEPSWTWHRNRADTFSLPPVPPLVVNERPVTRSLTLLLLGLGFGWAASCFAQRPGRSVALGVGGLLLAWAYGGVGQGAVVRPTEEQGRAIHAALMQRVYAAFDSTTEEGVYRLLASSVEPALLDGLYGGIASCLIQREEGGGARGRVESLEIEGALVRPRANYSGRAAFEVQAEWVVGGRVVHFGHEHARRVRYTGLVTIVAGGSAMKAKGTGEGPPEGLSWVLAGLDVHSQVREVLPR